VRPLALLLLLGLALPARADTPLFDDGRWRVLGVAADGEPLPIAVSRNDAPLGDFAALRILYAQDAGFAPVLVLYAGGALEPSLPPPGVPGATAVLGRYADCDTGLTAPLRFVALELPEKAQASRFSLRGTLSNGDSLRSEKLRLRVLAPKPERVRVELRYRLVATRDVCVDREQEDATDEFRAVELVTQYLSPAQQLSDLTRYVKDVELDCDLFDCDFDKEWFCAALENETGPVLDAPKRLEGRDLELVHTTDAPAPTPTLSVELRGPHYHQFKPQGAVAASSDPLVRNVSFWADWVEVRRQYPGGKRVGTFRFALEALPPEPRSCDRRQD
jgi:hypothetical protein